MAVSLTQRSSSRRTVVGLSTVVALLAIWYLATSVTGFINPSRFPRPEEVLSAFNFIQSEGYGNGKLHQHVLHSLKLVAMGFSVAVAVGVPLGLLMGYSRRAEALINPTFLLLRPIPPLAWIPLAIVWLGLDDGSKILVIFVAAFVPSVINSYTGVRNIETPMMEAARMLGIKGWRMVVEVLVPGSLPMIFTGLRLSLQASWTTLVAAEQIGALDNLLADAHMGRQGSEGVLKDHRDLGAANLIELDRGQTQDLLTLEPDRSARLAVSRQ